MGRRKKQIMVYDGNWSSIILRNSRRQSSTCPQYSQLRKGTAVGIDFKFSLRTVGYLHSNHGLVGTFWLAGWLFSSQGDIINAFPPSASEAAPAGMMKTSQPRTGFKVKSNLVSLRILQPWCVVLQQLCLVIYFWWATKRNDKSLFFCSFGLLVFLTKNS